MSSHTRPPGIPAAAAVRPDNGGVSDPPAARLEGVDLPDGSIPGASHGPGFGGFGGGPPGFLGGPPPFAFVPFTDSMTQLPPRLPNGRFPIEVVPDAMVAPLATGVLTVVTQIFRRWHSRTVEKEWGVTGPRVTMLVILVQARSLTMGELASRMEVTPRAVTRLVDGLESDGLVMRTKDPKDRRVIHVTCTQRALDLAAERMPALGTRMSGLFDGISTEDLRTFVVVATTVGERVRSQLAEAGSPVPSEDEDPQ